ncbi:hypothetical protein BDW67DRAFT_153189 [Aspergillus spinulosporus]
MPTILLADRRPSRRITGTMCFKRDRSSLQTVSASLGARALHKIEFPLTQQAQRSGKDIRSMILEAAEKAIVSFEVKKRSLYHGAEAATS